MDASKKIEYRRHYVVLKSGRWLVKTWLGDTLGSFKSLEDAKADIDRIMKGSNRTDASQYGCPI